MNLLDGISAYANPSSLSSSKEEIEALFRNLKFDEKPSEIFSYYQGCGTDICTASMVRVSRTTFPEPVRETRTGAAAGNRYP